MTTLVQTYGVIKVTELASVLNMICFLVSSEISDLCEISDLLLFLGYFASQNKEIKPGNYYFDVCCVNQHLWRDVRNPQQAVARE